MSMTVFLNEIRAGAENTDRLVTYQPSADSSMEVGSWIDMVVAIKGRYSKSPDESSPVRFDKFMAHISFGKLERVSPPELERPSTPGLEFTQGSLEDLGLLVESAKQRGLTDLHSWISIVDPDSFGPSEEELGTNLNRCKRALLYLGQAERMCERLGGKLDFSSHPANLLKVELRSDGEFSSFDGLNTQQDGSDGIPLAEYQKWVSILRMPSAN